MIEFSRYGQLGTITLEGSPTVRTIHIRGLTVDPLTGRGGLRFSTDARSTKMEEFGVVGESKSEGGRYVELCWFFPITREQYRLRCQVAITYTDSSRIDTLFQHSSHSQGLQHLRRTDPMSLEAHRNFWKDHSSQARSMFELQQPGTIKKKVVGGDLDRYESQEIDENTPSANFCSIVLLPVRCDYLKLPRPADDTRGQITKVQHHESQLQPNRSQIRWLHTYDETTKEWTAVELNP